MSFRCLPRIVVQGCYAQDEHLAAGSLRNQVAAAIAAEVPVLSGRRFERLERFEALEPLEMLTRYAGRCVERSGMGLAARST